MYSFSQLFKGYRKPGGVRELLTLALPMMISTACDGVMTFTDRLMLSRVGPDEMNAAMGGYVTYQMLIFFFVGLTGYSNALVAQYYGAGQNRNAPVAIFQAFLIALLSIPVIWALKPLAVLLFGFSNLPESQLPLQIQYLDILTMGALFAILRQTLACFFTGIGKARMVMLATLTAMVVNVVLDYFFIFGVGELEPMGVRGAALATVFGNVSAMLILFAAYFGKKYRSVFDTLHSFRFDKIIMMKLLKYGYPAGLEVFLGFVAFFCMTLMFQSQGAVEATATTLMFNWDMVSYIPLLGIEIAVTSLAGRYMGAGQPQRAHRAAKSAIRVGLFYSIVVLILFVGIPEVLVRVFHPGTPDPVFESAVPLAKTMIRIASLYVIAQTLAIAYIGTLRGAGDTLFAMLVSVATNWLFLPIQFVALYVYGASVPFTWFLFVACYLCFCLVMYRRFHSGKWKLMHVVDKQTVQS